MSAPFSILVVDDEEVQRETLADILRGLKFKVFTASSSTEALELLQDQSVDCLLTDFRMPGHSGVDLSKMVAASHPETSLFIMTAYADVPSVIEAMRTGVLDYFLKPLNVDALIRKIELIRERKILLSEVHSLRQQLNQQHDVGRLLGNSPQVKAAQHLIEQVAQTKGSVLITGESGTGKEIAAREIHRLSAQKDQKFVALNCAAIPENLLESELFGHKKGAFTGAVSDKQGLFQVADGGTLFLDEIGEMPKSLQVKLLRPLQEREITPVGSTESIKVDVRVIAATNRDLKKAVEEGHFRKDLYYRINVVEISMPTLRERTEDIPLLVSYFIQKYSKELRRPASTVSARALKKLMNYSWPGNIRELENVIERALMLSGDDQILDIAHLPSGFQEIDASQPDALELSGHLQSVARLHITRVLEMHGGDKKAAAKTLGLGLSSLYRKLEELGLTTTVHPSDSVAHSTCEH